jgi:hypothetical protein
MSNKANVWEVSTLTFHLSNELMKGNGKMEVIFRPSIGNNFECWKVFNDDKQILIFMNNLQEFSNFEVNWEEQGNEYLEIYEPKENPIPKGLISLENIFNINDMCKNKKEIVKPSDYIELNIGSDQDPRMIKIGKGTSEKERKDLINIVNKYRDFFPLYL